MKEIVYNPSQTIAQNAKNNGVSIATVRLYIKSNGIDRRYDEKLKVFTTIKGLQEQHPDYTASQIQSLSGYALNTVKKYMKMVDFPFVASSDKYSAFDLGKSNNVIKSVSASQTEILNNILQLYIKSDHYEADFTFSTGVFWHRIKKPDLKFDKYPQMEGVKPLTEALSLPDGTLSSCVVDLPFLVRGYGGKITERFTSFGSEDELFATNKEMVELAYHKLRRGGFLVMKTMDVSYALKQLWVSDFVTQVAQDKGFELKDKFILIANKRPLHKGMQQHFARKHHSYFFVFKKK
jgi:hypothetical protein